MRLLALDGKLSPAELMQDPARFFVPEVIDLLSLQGTEELERAPCQLRTDPDGLQGSDESVSAEEGHEPRKTRCRHHITFTLIFPDDPERAQIRDGPVQHILDDRVFRFESRHLVQPVRQRPFCALSFLRKVIVHRFEHASVDAEGRPDLRAPELPGPELQVPHEVVALHSRGYMRERRLTDGLYVGPFEVTDYVCKRALVDDPAAQNRQPGLSAESRDLVAEEKLAPVGIMFFINISAPVADPALDLEQIREIRGCRQPDLASHALPGRVVDADLLVEPAPHEPKPPDRERVRPETGKIRVGQKERGRVVVDH